MIKRSHGLYETFDRKDGSKTTTYCAGCGHGIIQKLIAEAMHDLGIEDRTVFVSPVGCAAFCSPIFWSICLNAEVSLSQSADIFRNLLPPARSGRCVPMLASPLKAASGVLIAERPAAWLL